jgi:quinoprotein glucose dehydrogenase
MGLVGTADLSALLAVAEDESDAVRMGVLLALRRKHSPEVARFLNDVQPALVVEAARAILDLPIPEAMPQLAALVDRAGLTSDALLRRVLNANFRLGGAENALAVARYATRSDAPEAMRLEAVKMLADWTEPAPTDRVLNLWRPLEPRDSRIAKTALRAVLPGIVTASDAVRGAGAKVAAKLGIREIGPALVKLAEDASQPAGRRVEAIDALASLNDPQLETVMQTALAAEAPEVRAAGRRVLAKLDPAQAVGALQKALESGETVERQNALATLAALDDPRVDAILSAWLDKLLAGDVAAEIQLDLLEAAAKRKSGDVQERLAKYEAGRAADDPLAAYRATLQGGDAERGRDIFFHRVQVSCVRCHTIDGQGGEVGPDLSKIGREKQRDYLLEAIVLPNKAIAKGFSTAMLILDSGKVVSGIVKEETNQSLRLITAEGKFVTVAKDEIDERLKGRSPMPADVVKLLSKRGVRDLVEFLASRK